MTERNGIAPLAVQQLRWRCDPAQLPFETTNEIEPISEIVGQDRAVGALALAFELGTSGYNAYVAGPVGTGRTTTVYRQIEKAIVGRPAPPDWCYLHNFRDPHEPIAVRLPAGRGPELAQDLEQLIEVIRDEIPRAFQSERYEQRRLALAQSIQQEREAVFRSIHAMAEELGFKVEFGPGGMVMLPLLATGQPMSPEAFELLPDESKAAIRARGQQLERRIEEAFLALRRIDREGSERLTALARETALSIIGPHLQSLRGKWAGEPRVIEHFTAIQEDLLEHLDELQAAARRGEGGPPIFAPAPPYLRYGANVVVTHDPKGGPPVVFEPNPTYYNLTGRIDYRAAMGTMYTDFTLIRPGALHRANGGYLVLQARDLLTNPFAWDALKRCLRDREVRIENLGEQLSAIPTATLKPSPIPLDVKVVLIGDLMTYNLLHQLDDDFRKLFKVKAQFSPTVERTPAGIDAYARFVSAQVRWCGHLPFTKGAVALVIEHGARLAEHQERLATRFGAIADLIAEASHEARRAGATQVLPEHVEAALAKQEYRLNLLEAEMQRLIDERTVAISTSGASIGQVNGLSVIDLVDYVFARPSRITARVGMGADGIVNIERETQLSRPIHSKGVLILSGYLLGTYAQHYPLSLSARLTFEQVYSEVEGDSASSAELYALLSALARVPIKQGIAVTGSINQLGEIQAVGGITAKVEGFYAVCKSQGLTGEQGVIIPQTNVPHLMLKPEVLDAVEAGKFHVWAISTVDEGVEVLTGLPAGARRKDGTFEPGTVHARVQQRLATFAARMARFGQRPTRMRRRSPSLAGATSPPRA